MESSQADDSQISAGSPSANNASAQNQPGFRRQRASRACETCHSRKVRCDAASLGVPCTNCVAFSIDCKIPAPKRKKAAKAATKDSDSEHTESVPAHSPRVDHPAGYDFATPPTAETSQSAEGATETSPAIATTPSGGSQNLQNALMRPKYARAPIKEAGRVAYMGESTNLSLLVHDNHGTTDVVHYPLPDKVAESKSRGTDLDALEMEILHQRGAFLLPPRALCDELVDAFFKWIAPVVPIVNRTLFMARYQDPKHPPSILLLQAILLAGSRVCTNPQLTDSSGSTGPAAMTFYKRAKALYDANYEDDRVTIVQALILMGWYWESPEDVTKNVFYWTRVATVVAQGVGIHRSVENSQLSRTDKRLWKRIWWTLFTRDRSVAVALGRPVFINTQDSDVGMLTEDDFIETEPGAETESSYPADPVHVQFFLQYVRLCEIMGIVLSQQYSVASRARRQNAIDLTQSDMALADWLQNCPKEVYWEKSTHHFWSALLHANYYTTLCLLHRAHMPPATADSDMHDRGYPNDSAYPSRNIAFQAAGMITSIIEQLRAANEMKYTPAFIVYSLFSALIMHIYQMRSSVPSVVAATQGRIGVCMDALQEVSKVWFVAKMVHSLFESILGNKTLEDRLQKAAGRRHKKAKFDKHADGHDGAISGNQQSKRKYSQIDIGFANGPPTPQVSYERSRPQTPAVTPQRDLGQSTSTNSSGPMAAPPSTEGIRAAATHDAFMGSSRNPTRPPTPFNSLNNNNHNGTGATSVPATPPDLFLITRDSPHISQSVWENFQPGYLFPENSSMSMPSMAANNGVDGTALDPQLQLNNLPSTPARDSQTGARPSSTSVPHLLDPFGSDHGSDDHWSSGLESNPSLVAPTTLNMDDWYQFFGINGIGGDK